MPLFAALPHKLHVNVQVQLLLQVERVAAQSLHFHHQLKSVLYGSHVHIFHLKSECFIIEAPFTTVKLSPPYNLIILIARSTVEINRFPVLVDPSRHSLHRIGARR